TRFLSDMELELNHYRPMLLSSHIKNENELLSVDLTNPDIHGDHNMVIPKGTLHISRNKFLQDGACHELIMLFNYGSDTYDTELQIAFTADYKDIFEIRGMERKKRGELQKPQVNKNDHVMLSYKGLDDIERQTHLYFSPAPYHTKPYRVVYKIKLAPKEAYSIHCTAVFQSYSNPVAFEPYAVAFNKIKTDMEKNKEMIADIVTDNEQFN